MFFRPRHGLIGVELGTRALKLAQLRRGEDGMKAVVGNPQKGLTAVVGGKTVRVGDLLDGFRVVAIDAEGVVLEKPASTPNVERPKGKK